MKIKYVSFDIYDTLVSRIISPKQIYDLMEVTLNHKYNIQIKDFCKKRLLAEANAKKKFGVNYNIDNIYNVHPFKQLSKEKINIIINLEKEYEISCAVPNRKGKELYDRYKKKYKIISISDMYLDKKTISMILKNNGYDIDKVYISCEENSSKRQRNLFLKVISDLGISKKEILHVGDAKRSDYINPKLLGIKSRKISHNVDFRMIVNNDINDYYYNIGFNLFGPLLYEFCKWIKKCSKSENSLLFVSREGEFIKECYDTLFDNSNTKMIYFSRKSVISGIGYKILQNKTITDLINMISIKRNETVRDLFNRLGLNSDKYQERLLDLYINLDDLITNDIDLFYSRYKKEILMDLEKQNIVFEKYLNSVFINEDNMIVDIGWKGSMQNLLNEYLKISKSNKSIKGLYLGIMNTDKKSGFLFEKNDIYCQNILNYSGLLELIMMPNYGSVVSYDEFNGIVQPIFDSTEFSKESIEIIKKIQNGILDFLKKMKLLDNTLCFDKNTILNKLNKFGSNPSLKDIKYLEKLDFYDNGISYKLIEPIVLRELKKNFVNTKWKTAFLKKLFKISLPYNKVVNLLRKKADKNDKG